MPHRNQYPSEWTNKEQIALTVNERIRFQVEEDHGSFSPPHWHDAIEVIYILEGSSTITLLDRSITLEPGQFLLLNSGLVHTARCPSSGNRAILVQIPDEFLASYLPDPSQLWFSIDYNSKEPEIQAKVQRMKELLRSMGSSFVGGREGYLLGFMRELFEFLEILYSSFLHEFPGEYHPRSAQVLSRLDRVLSYTRDHYAEPISLREAAAVVALQPEYFCRFFRQNMGMTYLSYLNDYRLSKIYRDLITTELGVRELAEKHGFTNEKLFHRLFRERFRMTPLQVRKTARAAEKHLSLSGEREEQRS